MSMEQWQRKVDRWRSGLNDAAYGALRRGAMRVVATSQRKYLTGPRPLRLGVMTGRLRRSVHYRMSRIPAPKAKVGTNVKYAKIHEYGGKIDHPGGTAYFPTEKGQVRFISNKAAAGHNYPRTQAHKIKIPPRPFLRPAVNQELPRVMRMIRDAVVGAYGK